MENNNKESKLREIQETEFAAMDLNLYLDTHPDDEDAIKRLNDYSEKLHELVKSYEETETMLFAHHVKNKEDMNNWINDPWPWEKQ